MCWVKVTLFCAGEWNPLGVGIVSWWQQWDKRNEILRASVTTLSTLLVLSGEWRRLDQGTEAQAPCQELSQAWHINSPTYSLFWSSGLCIGSQKYTDLRLRVTKRLGMVARAWGSGHSGGWRRRIAWAQEFWAAVCHAGQRSTLSSPSLWWLPRSGGTSRLSKERWTSLVRKSKYPRPPQDHPIFRRTAEM